MKKIIWLMLLISAIGVTYTTVAHEEHIVDISSCEYVIHMIRGPSDSLTTQLIANAISSRAQKYKLDVAWIIAVGAHESNLQPNAKGKTGDIGLFQITKWALDEYNKANKTKYTMMSLYDININTEIATWFIAQKMNESHHRYPVALAKYNAGMYHETIGQVYYNKVAAERERVLEIYYRYTQTR